MSKTDEFKQFREQMNKKMMAAPNNKIMKRIYSLDTLAYQEGALSKPVKEMLGLAASMVLRCDDCINYHLQECHALGLSTEEVMEIFGIANLIGGTIVIPHTRRALAFWEELQTND